jgi:hypothetical protein
LQEGVFCDVPLEAVVVPATDSGIGSYSFIEEMWPTVKFDDFLPFLSMMHFSEPML